MHLPSLVIVIVLIGITTGTTAITAARYFDFSKKTSVSTAPLQVIKPVVESVSDEPPEPFEPPEPSEPPAPPASPAPPTPTDTRCIVTLFDQKFDISRMPAFDDRVFVCNTDSTEAYQNRYGSNLTRMRKYALSDTSGDDDEAEERGRYVKGDIKGAKDQKRR